MKNTLLLVGEGGESARVDPGSPAEALFRSLGYVTEAELAEAAGGGDEGAESAPKRRGGRPKKVQE